ncbi:PHD finger protein 23B-like [Cinclus cinclus]|uniref:PHD finger protein 23B-like n=1 Tax=Cinclus cinclus TaxID=127875 RepID=UPI002E11B61B
MGPTATLRHPSAGPGPPRAAGTTTLPGAGTDLAPLPALPGSGQRFQRLRHPRRRRARLYRQRHQRRLLRPAPSLPAPCAPPRGESDREASQSSSHTDSAFPPFRRLDQSEVNYAVFSPPPRQPIG